MMSSGTRRQITSASFADWMSPVANPSETAASLVTSALTWTPISTPESRRLRAQDLP